MEVQFPTLVYRSPGPHAGPAGSKGYAFEGVKDAEQLAKFEAAGWSLSFDEAINGKPAPVVADDVPSTDNTLADRATELGIKIDGRWSETRLKQEIAKAEAAQ